MRYFIKCKFFRMIKLNKNIEFTTLRGPLFRLLSIFYLNYLIYSQNISQIFLKKIKPHIKNHEFKAKTSSIIKIRKFPLVKMLVTFTFLSGFHLYGFLFFNSIFMSMFLLQISKLFHYYGPS